jgi:phosphotransferase system  glucose/maltose/N-acetylglucosamine-specific IIC component
MKDNRRQPKDVVADSRLNKLKKTLNYTIAVIIILGVALLALILFNLIFIPKLKANINDLKTKYN